MNGAIQTGTRFREGVEKIKGAEHAALEREKERERNFRRLSLCATSVSVLVPLRETRRGNDVAARGDLRVKKLTSTGGRDRVVTVVSFEEVSRRRRAKEQ